MEKRKIIIDVDTGCDDAVALLLALHSPELEVLGVTTVAGNVEVEQTTENTLKVLDCAGAPKTLPVARGAEKPLRRPLHTAKHIHGAEGLGNIVLPPPQRSLNEREASEFIIDTVMNAKGKVTLIPVGPLTNIARAIDREPAILDKIDEVIIMGGAVFVPGNVTPHAEFNIYVDPEAAKAVFRSGAKILLVPLDATMKAAVTRERLLKSRRADTSVERFVSEVLLAYMDKYRQYLGRDCCLLHDALAVAASFDRRLVKSKPLYIDVDVSDGETRGRTFAVLDREPNMEVCVDADEEAFARLIFSRLVEA